MTRSCPLPVDWLDYLDGIGDPSLTEHLATCRSCQELVASLKASGVQTTIPHKWTDGILGNTDAVWINTAEPTPGPPSPAEFWFSASHFDLSDHYAGRSAKPPRFGYRDVDRMLVLVVSDPADDHLGWTDVVPVLSDIEAATETDLLFTAQENTLGSPWRALFANQSKVARGQLDTRVGTLTDLGRQVLTAALEGSADESRWGVPLQGPFDARARLDDSIENGLKRLRTPWLIVQDHANECEDSDDAPRLTVLISPQAQPSQPEEHPYVFWMSPQADAVHEHALAAASSEAKAKWWVVDHKQFTLHGRLDVEWGKGLLVFVVTTAELRTATRLRLLLIAANGKRYSSDPFKPARGATVALGEQLTDADVDQLGAEMVP